MCHTFLLLLQYFLSFLRLCLSGCTVNSCWAIGLLQVATELDVKQFSLTVDVRLPLGHALRAAIFDCGEEEKSFDEENGNQKGSRAYLQEEELQSELEQVSV